MGIISENLPKYELWINLIAVIVSIIAVVFWIKLYKNLYKEDPKEARGWMWLFVGVLSILLFNISSIYLLFVTAPLYELMDIIGRTLVGISLTIGAYLLYKPMKKGFVYRFIPVKPIAEKIEKESESKHFLEKGHSYLINEEKPIKSNEIFLDLVMHGAYGLYITRRNPEEIRKKYGLEKTPIIWLTREKTINNSVDPRNIVELSHTIKEFIKKTDDGVVLLDGIEYLIIQNNFNEILKFIQSLEDAISLSNSRLIIPLDPSTIGQQELHLLKREMLLIRTDI